MTPRTRIAVVDSQPLFRKGLVDTLVASKFDVVAEGETADDIVRIVQDGKPDVLIFDMAVSANILATASNALRKRQGLKIVVLTNSDHERNVADALRVGVHGYILKGVSGSELVSALTSIHRGDRYITPDLATRLLMQSKGKSLLEDKAADMGLTLRDRSVLRHLTKGLSNRQLAVELGVDIRTIKYYLTQVFKKMGVHTRVEAVLEAQKLGLDASES